MTVDEIVLASGGRLLTGNGQTEIHSFSINSKEVPTLVSGGNVLFVPLMGEKVDGHQFIESALAEGAKAFFIREGFPRPEIPEGRCMIEVKDTLIALQDTALHYRSKFPLPVVGITGSVGKTSTKEMVAAALETGLTVHKTKGNFNSTIGVPLTLFGILETDKASVLEMGISEFGEMSDIAKVARPNYAVLTNIGSSHIGNLLSRENIRKEKLHITDAFGEDSILFLNIDDPLLKELVEQKEILLPDTVKNIVTFGIDEEADFSASSICVSGDGTDFVVSYPKASGSASKVSEHIHLKTLGLHNVRNALAAIAVACELGISPSLSKKGLSQYEPLSMRGNVLKSYGMTIVNDTYNASPDSMKAAVEVLASMRGGIEPIRRRILVLADILELGEDSEKEHRSVGDFIKDYNKKDPNHRMNYLITVGTDSKFIREAASEGALETAPVTKHFTTNAAAISYLKELVKKGDAILIKGSRGMFTEEIVTALAADR